MGKNSRREIAREKERERDGVSTDYRITMYSSSMVTHPKFLPTESDVDCLMVRVKTTWWLGACCALPRTRYPVLPPFSFFFFRPARIAREGIEYGMEYEGSISPSIVTS